MAEHDTAQAPPPAPAEEPRALAELASLEQARGDRADLEDLARMFDAAIATDLERNPGFVYTGPGSMQRAAIARMVRITLHVARERGTKGVRLEHLKRVYQALEVPPRLAELIERKLTTDGVATVSCGRLYFAATPQTWAKLARTRAE